MTVEKPLEDKITPSSRIIAYVEIAVIAIFISFFLLHFFLSTRFFSVAFTIYMQFLLISVLAINLGVIFIRLRLNSKNRTRPIRFIANLSSAVFLVILLLQFPFSPQYAGAFIPFIGTIISDLTIVYGDDILAVMVFFFAIFGIYDAFHIYLRSQGEHSPSKSAINDNQV